MNIVVIVIFIVGVCSLCIEISISFDFPSHHQLEHMIKSDPDNAVKLRKDFQAHLEHINEKVNHTMQLLYKVPKVARKFILELPSWVPKLHLVS